MMKLTLQKPYDASCQKLIKDIRGTEIAVDTPAICYPKGFVFDIVLLMRGGFIEAK
jgi:hypothetical protein